MKKVDLSKIARPNNLKWFQILQLQGFQVIQYVFSRKFRKYVKLWEKYANESKTT